MNNINNASTDDHQWLHYYQQTTAAANPEIMTSVGGGTGTEFSDTTSTIVTTSFTTKNTSSPVKSTSLGNTTDVHLNPQGLLGKPIRRRSRAPRRNPTTLLNASTTNFRSLVQQFTGCQNAKASAFGSRKGPVNLSFGMPRNHNDHYMSGTNSRIAPTESDYFHDQLLNPVVHKQHQGQQWQQQEMFERLQINNKKNMQSGGLDEFSMDDLHELVHESSSFSTSVNKQDGNYYF